MTNRATPSKQLDQFLQNAARYYTDHSRRYLNREILMGRGVSLLLFLSSIESGQPQNFQHWLPTLDQGNEDMFQNTWAARNWGLNDKEESIPPALVPDASVHIHRSHFHSAVKPIHGDLDAHHHLSALITKAASKQTYYTIRWLVDRDRSTDAYRAYAYFRWLDDILDADLLKSTERIALLERQHALVEAAYRDDWALDPTVEEQMLLDLIRSDHEPDSGLQAYILNMMAVIAFDVRRTGQLISQQELDDYTRYLAIAVTEVLHHYIGHNQFAPYDKTRYFAVTAAHITHMLRDTYEDIAVGYYNIPHEFLDSYGIAPWDIKSDAYRHWVKTRVQLARNYFRIGKIYLSQVENYRARIAGYTYVARFESVLDIIERDNYQLRAKYDKGKSLQAGLKMGWFVFTHMFRGWLAKATSLQAEIYQIK